jgi:hypothetical protein
VGEVEAMESFLAYAKMKRILISPAVEDLKQHAYNVKWWIDSVDKQRCVCVCRTCPSPAGPSRTLE